MVVSARSVCVLAAESHCRLQTIAVEPHVAPSMQKPVLSLFPSGKRKEDGSIGTVLPPCSSWRCAELGVITLLGEKLIQKELCRNLLDFKLIS